MKGYNYPWYKRPLLTSPTREPSYKPTRKPDKKKPYKKKPKKDGGVDADDSNEAELGSGSNSILVKQRFSPKSTKPPKKAEPDPRINELDNITEKDAKNLKATLATDDIDNRILNDDEDDGDDDDDLKHLASGDGALETMNELPPRDGSGYGPMADEVSEAKIVNKTTAMSPLTKVSKDGKLYI